jgi:PHD/YefM family antitoxin component YafN of YafNO toxin-antitoxin module
VFQRLRQRPRVTVAKTPAPKKRNGRHAAVLLNVNECERLKATLDVLSDPALMRQIRARDSPSKQSSANR